MVNNRRRVVRHHYTPAVKGTPAKSGGIDKYGKVIPATPAVPSTPGFSTTETQDNYYSSPSLPVNSQFVVLILFVLFLVISWNDLVLKIVDISWNSSSKNDIRTLSWGKYLGMIVFIVLASFIASINEDTAGIVLMISVAILVVYMVENNGGGISQFFNWLTSLSGKSSNQSKGAS